jgi:transmembrane sensor
MITDELLFRYLSRETSEKEDSLIRRWLTENPEQAVRLEQLTLLFEEPETDISKDKISGDWNTISSKLTNSAAVKPSQPSLVIRISRIAAIVLLLIGTGLIWLFQSNTHTFRNKELYTKSILLPDGTQVDLGPKSKLVYGKEFMEGNRLIRLTGEAFFDVVSDIDHPFTVIAGKARIKVTGTKFVVNASPVTEEVEVSVRSGNVLFYNSDTMDKNSFRMGLVAGEKGIFYPALNRMDKTRDPYYQSTP